MFKFIKNRKSFTDKLYFMNWFMVMTVTQECVALILLSAPLVMSETALTCLNTLLTCAWAELATHTAFIIWKAKAENQLKFNKTVETNNDDAEGVG